MSSLFSRTRSHLLNLKDSFIRCCYPGKEFRSLSKLNQSFRKEVESLLRECRARGLRPTVLATFRDQKRQSFYIRKGWSQKCDSFHTACDSDGSPAALAVDIGFVGLHRSDPNDRSSLAQAYTILAEEARKRGLKTGLSWKNRAWHKDYPEIGWDPGHVEIDSGKSFPMRSSP